MVLEVKNPLRAQSKCGPMGSSARTGKFVETPPPVGAKVIGWMSGSVGEWVGAGHITKY